MRAQTLMETARALVAPGKGILAADESFPTIEKRLKAVGVESTEANRRDYREMLFRTSEAENYISGVILFYETIFQKGADGTPLAQILESKGIIPGIKVDKGAKPLANAPNEKVTEGLDGLRDRFKEYAEAGARFAKWRAVIKIGDGIPSNYCLQVNAHALARYAALAQEANLVPIVEPEVLMDGDHTLETCEQVTGDTLEAVFAALNEQRILLEGMLLKPNMVLSGKECTKQADVNTVAEATVRCLRRHVPSAVPGIVFLSGGQDDITATEHLNAMNAMGPHPWELSFSYGRALQAPALNTWRGDSAQVKAAQDAFRHRAKCNGSARSGQYNKTMEQAA